MTQKEGFIKTFQISAKLFTNIDELKKYKKGDKIKVKVLEIKPAEQKVRVGFKQCLKDPFDYFLAMKKKLPFCQFYFIDNL